MTVLRRALTSLATLTLAAGLAPALAACQPTSSGTPAGSAAGDRSPGLPAGSTSEQPSTDRPDRPDRPNVVVVMADDMRADDLLFAPAISRIVGDHGIRFDNSFSPYPLCCPARASFLTGQYAHNHRVFWHESPYGYGSFDDSRTLATAMQAAGYRTGFVGKYLNRYGLDDSRVSGEPSATYVPQGWDDWRASVESLPDAPFDGGTYDYLDTPFNVNGTVEDRWEGQYQTDVIGDMSVAMARRFAGRDQPFLMYVNYLAPHFGNPIEPDDPGLVLADNGETYDFRSPARPAWVRGRFDDLVDRGHGLPRDGGPAEADIDDKPEAFARQPEPNAAERLALRDLTRQRAESIYVMDRQVERLVRELRRSGEWDDTVLVFTSDNGYYLGEHRRRTGKVQAHEPSLRVPLLITGPGMRDGRTVAAPVTTMDLTATLLDLGRAEPPHAPDGTSVVPALTGADGGWDRPVLTEATHGQGRDRATPGFRGPRTSIGVRTGRFVLIRHQTGEQELYDLWRDPGEMTNRHGAPSYAEEERLLERVWWRLRNCAGADCLDPLPPELRVGADDLARHTQAWWRATERTYGYR